MIKLIAISGLAVLAAVTAAQAVVTYSTKLETTPASAPVIAAAVTPAPAPAPRESAIPKGSDGHFWAQARVNSRDVRFLVDTGATAVALSPEDARSLGFSPAGLDYAYKVNTAAGPARAARVTLASITVDGAKVDDVEAYVIEGGLDVSLLGMSYLNRLKGYNFTPTSLVLLQ
jgi:aspartyl protease family protein